MPGSEVTAFGPGGDPLSRRAPADRRGQIGADRGAGSPVGRLSLWVSRLAPGLYERPMLRSQASEIAPRRGPDLTVEEAQVVAGARHETPPCHTKPA